MKIQSNTLKLAFPLFLLSLGGWLFAPAQSTPAQSMPAHSTPAQSTTRADKKAAKKALIRNLVDSQTYVFVAQSAMPMSGHTRQLTSEYDVKVTKSAIVSYLPYFGRAYSAPMDPNQGGIQFTSKDFVYTMNTRKNGAWDIFIKPRDYPDVQQFSLTITEDGYATLQVTSTSRQAISFTGVITALPKKKGQ